MRFRHSRLVLSLFALILVAAAACNSAPVVLDTELAEDVAGAVGDEAAAPDKPALNAVTATLETDAAGVTVGFTSDGRPFRGDPGAPVVMEEFSDYQCPFCARYVQQTLPSLERTHVADGSVVMVFYDFPLTNIHAQAVGAATAARCAGDQGAANYWAMHDALFASVDQWSVSDPRPVFTGYARELGLDTDAFAECLTDERFLEKIRADMEIGRDRGVTGTPAFFVNDQFISGAQPLNIFEQYIAAATRGEVVAQPEPAAQQPADPALPPTPAAISADGYAGILGDAAPITIVEYTDYGCPFCARHSQETLPTLLTQMIETGRVQYIMKDLPLDQLHPEARAAANAARCAGDQEIYWEMHDLLFDRQSDWSGLGDERATERFLAYGAELGLEMDAYTTCVNEATHADVVAANANEAAALGIQGTPYFFINGFPVRGAQPLEVFELVVGQYEEGGAEAVSQLYVPQPTATPPPATVGDAPGIGDPDAPIVIIEFSDFQCPFCARHHTDTYSVLLKDYVETGQVYYVFKNFVPTLLNPSYHPQAIVAAEAGLCAGEQDAFWEMHDVLFERQGEWGNDGAAALFAGYAEELGLDGAAFTACLESGRHLAQIERELDEGRAQGVTGTPAFVINGQLVVGAQPLSVFQQIISSLQP